MAKKTKKELEKLQEQIIIAILAITGGALVTIAVFYCISITQMLNITNEMWDIIIEQNQTEIKNYVINNTLELNQEVITLNGNYLIKCGQRDKEVARIDFVDCDLTREK